MTWKTITEVDYKPEPNVADGIPFILTPQERDQAKIFSIEAERNRRNQNARELAWALRNAVRHPDDAA